MSKTRVATIRGTDIDFHVSWLLTLPLLVVAFALLYFPEMMPEATTAVYWQLGLLASVLIFLSVIWHELGHMIRARRLGLHVRRSTLFVFGSVVELEEEPATPAITFHVAVAGPLASMSLGVLLLLLWLVSRSVPWLGTTLLLLAIFNLGLGVLNLLPVYPLDGGQMMRALLWRWRGRPELDPNNWAFLGELTGASLLGAGVVTLLIEELLIAIWLGVVGWAIQSVNIGQYLPARLKRPLRRVTQPIRDVEVEVEEKDPDPDPDAVKQSLAETGAQKVLLVENGRPIGLIDSDELLQRLGKDPAPRDDDKTT